jgi:Trk K+ transport system NAD-binding subunit
MVVGHDHVNSFVLQRLKRLFQGVERVLKRINLQNFWEF